MRPRAGAGVQILRCGIETRISKETYKFGR